MPIFDATQHAPQQSGGKHPPGNKFPFVITATEVKNVKDGGGKKLFEVVLTSPAGQIRNNYNLWNDSDMARKISVGQLSALCHATGIFKINFRDPIQEGPDGKELIGGKGLMDVGFQAGQEPSADKPEGGYVEVKKVYDVNGNEPGQSKPQTEASSEFGQTTQTKPEDKPQMQSGWGGETKSNAAPTGNGGGWTQGSGGEKPPWS